MNLMSNIKMHIINLVVACLFYLGFFMTLMDWDPQFSAKVLHGQPIIF